MDTVTKSELVRDVHGEIIVTEYAQTLQCCIAFAKEHLGVELETVEVGECGGNALLGLLFSKTNPHALTDAERAAIDGFLWCGIQHDEFDALRRIESKLDLLLSRLGQSVATDTEMASAGLGASIATCHELIADIEDATRRNKGTAGAGKLAAKKSSVKRSA